MHRSNTALPRARRRSSTDRNCRRARTALPLLASSSGGPPTPHMSACPAQTRLITLGRPGRRAEQLEHSPLEREPPERSGLVQPKGTVELRPHPVADVEEYHFLVQPQRPRVIPLKNLQADAGKGNRDRDRVRPPTPHSHRCLSAAAADVLGCACCAPSAPVAPISPVLAQRDNSTVPARMSNSSISGRGSGISIFSRKSVPPTVTMVREPSLANTGASMRLIINPMTLF